MEWRGDASAEVTLDAGRATLPTRCKPAGAPKLDSAMQVGKSRLAGPVWRRCHFRSLERNPSRPPPGTLSISTTQGHVAEWLRSGLQILYKPYPPIPPYPKMCLFIATKARVHVCLSRRIPASAIAFDSNSGNISDTFCSHACGGARRAPAAALRLWRNSFAELMPLIGKWFVFWPVGVRLFVAGMRQVAQPRFTAEHIFQINDRAVFHIIREVGFGNLAKGNLGLLTLLNPTFLLPAAIAVALYYGLAGIGRLPVGRRWSPIYGSLRFLPSPYWHP